MNRSFVLLSCLAALSIHTGCGSSDPNPNEDAGVPVVDCPAPTEGPTTHVGQTITADETWTAAGSPHIIDSDFTVGAGVTLTFEPCAIVRIKAGDFLIVDGTLRARGTATQPIVISKDDATARFAALRIRHPGRAELAYVTISGGGDPSATAEAATIVVEGGSELPAVTPLLVDNVVVRDSGGLGIYLRQWTGFTPESRDLSITGAGAEVSERPFPMLISLNAVKTIPTGTYTGNAADEIQVIAESPNYKVVGAEQFKDRGVPYRIGGNGAFGVIEVDDPGLATLTLDPGVRLNFSSTPSSVGGLHIGGTRNSQTPSGALIAVGTADKPIVLSAQPDMRVAGGWEGVVVESIAPATKMEYVRIEYAGAHGGDNGYGCPPEVEFNADGALKIFQVPANRFLSNSVIADARGHGVYRGWEGDPVDFLPTNTFERIGRCLQVDPKDREGMCPANPACPL